MLPAHHHRPPCRSIAPLSLAIAGVLLSVAVPAVAQESKDKATDLARIEVTGSNIRRTDVETASPVQVISKQDIQNMKRCGTGILSSFAEQISPHGQSPARGAGVSYRHASSLQRNGSQWLTEAFAIYNELRFRDQLYQQAEDPRAKAYYLKSLLDDMSGRIVASNGGSLSVTIGRFGQVTAVVVCGGHTGQRQ